MGKGKALSCSWGLLLYFLTAVILHQHQHACAANPPRCAPSSCGKITNISYPFRLKDDPIACGDPRYELACEDNVTVLSLLSGKYYVQAINYHYFTIRLVDPAIQNSDCSSIPRYFLSSSNFTDTYNVSNDYNPDPYQATRQLLDNRRRFGVAFVVPVVALIFKHVIYLNCSNPVKGDPQYVDTAPCINWHSKGHFYAVVGDLPASNLKFGCYVKLVATTSILGWKRDSYYFAPQASPPYNQTFSYPEIHRMLLYGFDVSWMNLACEDSCGDRSCFFDESNKSIYCRSPHCRTPLGFETNCGNMSKLRIIMEDYVYGIWKGLHQVISKDIEDDFRAEISNISIGIGVVTGKYVLPYIIVRFVLGLIVFFMLLIYTCRRRHISMYEDIEDFLQKNTLMPIRYSYKEIKEMTSHFKNKLGEGGYGSVYKGKLRSGPFVAIKILGKSKANGQDFINEVATIGRIHHSNVVRLVGFCVEGPKRALVYEFMPNGSLDRYIFSKDDSVSLTYEKMYEISLGVAHGIAYLHQGCDMQILHFDIKPHNILLDENFNPKVSDFGLAKLYPIDNSIVTLTAARGTFGYMAPELFYQNLGGVSYKADVYSFGMLLMEMASKRRNLNPHVEHSSQLYFPFWIYDQLNKESEMEVEEVVNEEKGNVAKKMFIVALWCIQLKPNDRPSMKKVTEMLEGDIQKIEMPPKPSLYPNETIQEEIESNQTVSNDFASSASFHEETIVDPF